MPANGAPGEPYKPIRQSQLPQPTVPTSPPYGSASRNPTLRSASSPIRSAGPRPAKSSPSIAPGQTGSVRSIASQFGEVAPTSFGTRPALAARSSSATASGIPRPKTPSSRPLDNEKVPTKTRNRLHKSPPRSQNLPQPTRIQKAAQSRTPTPSNYRSFPSRPSTVSPSPSAQIDSSPRKHQQQDPKPGKLFGEIDGTSNDTFSIGHVIGKGHRRRGSDGSNPYMHASPTLPSSSFTYQAHSPALPHRRSRSEMCSGPTIQQPMDFAALSSVLQPDIVHDVMTKRGQTRIPGPPTSARHRPSTEAEYGLSSWQTDADHHHHHHHHPRTPSPASFGPLDELPRPSDQRLKASIREPSPQKSPPLRSSRPRQQVSARHSAKSSFEAGSPERSIPGAFRDSFVEYPQSPELSPEPTTQVAGQLAADSGHSRDTSDAPPSILTQLSSAVYRKQSRPNLTVEPHLNRYERAHTPGSVTEFEDNGTDFEDDTPLSGTRPDFQTHGEPTTNGENYQTESSSHSIDSDDQIHAHRDQRRAFGLTVETGHAEYQPPHQFVPHRPLEASPALSQDADNAGTIDIVLDAPSFWGRDSDGEHFLNNIIDEYQSSQSLSPQTIKTIQQHLLGSDDHMSIGQIEAVVRQEALYRQDSRASQASRPSPLQFDQVTKSEPFDSQPLREDPKDEKHAESNEVHIEDATLSKSASPSTKIGSEDGTASTLTPMPNRASAQTVHSISSDHPSLPEIQDTGGGLGLLGGEGHQTSTLLGPARAGTVSRSTESSLGSQQTYALSIDSQQATAGQQEIPETPPTSVSRPQSFRSTEQSSRKPSVDQRRPSASEQDLLSKRQRVIQEFVDTELSYQKDMRVLEDIYMATAESGADLAPRDIALIFGNLPDIAKFSREFSDRLKEATRGVWVRRPKINIGQKAFDRQSSISTTSANRADLTHDGLDEQADRRSAVGEVVLQFLQPMEKVYSDFLKRADSANQLLENLQGKESVQLWLQECCEYAKDLTEAWNINALLIKPTQRITRYPLLLTELKKFTPDNHPDRPNIDKAREGIMSITERINNNKKKSDLLGSMISYDGKKGSFFNSLTNKTRVKMGKIEFEDPDFNEAMSKVKTETHKLDFVLRDLQGYMVANETLMKAFTDLTRVLEAVADVKPSTHPEIESKWRGYINIVRELLAMGYPDHVLHVQKSVIMPLNHLLELYKKPETMAKRRKERLSEYVRYKNSKERGEKMDKKLVETGEQFEVISEALKEQVPIMRKQTAKVVELCEYNFAVLTGQWHEFWQRKIMPVIEDETWRQPFAEYVRHHREDWMHAEETAQAITERNKQLLQGTAEFYAISQGSRSASLASRQSPGFGTPASVHRGSTSSFSPPVSAPLTSSRPSTDSGRHHHHTPQRTRSRSHGVQTLSQPPLPPIPSMPNHDSTWYVGQTPPVQTNDAPSYEAAGMLGARPQVQRRPSSSTATSTHRSLQPSANQFARNANHVPKMHGRGVFSSALPMSDSPTEPQFNHHIHDSNTNNDYKVVFLAASLFDFKIDRTRQESGFPYLTYVPGEIFDVIGTKGELWLARNQDDSSNTIGWIWEKHFAKLLGEDDLRRLGDEEAS